MLAIVVSIIKQLKPFLFAQRCELNRLILLLSNQMDGILVDILCVINGSLGVGAEVGKI